MDRIRIAHVITGLASGGAETTLFKLLSHSDHERFNHSVLCLGRGGPLVQSIEALGVRVRVAGMDAATSLATGLFRALSTSWATKPDVIQGWMYHGNVIASLAARMSRRYIPLLWNIRNALYHLRSEKRTTANVIYLGARMSKGPRAIIYNSRVSARQHESIGYSKSSRLIIPNGFDCTRFAPSIDARADVRRELGCADETPIVGMIARWDAMKDHATFLRAAGILAESMTDVHFVLVGRGIDGDNAALRALVDGSSVGARVHLLGERNDIPSITASLDVSSLSSSSEARPNVIGEAMACAVAVVATNVGDTADLVGDCGWVVPAKNPHALAGAWHEALSMSADSRTELGMKARERVCTRFSIEKVTQQYDHLYEELSGTDRRPGGHPNEP